jgi:mercuric ion binding protein
VRATEQTVTLDVESLTCSLCPVTVRKALEKADGVTNATVSYEQHHAVIIYDDEIIDIPTLIETTTNAGFPSSVSEEIEAGYE